MFSNVGRILPAKVAKVMGEQAQHTLNKGLDSAYYRELVLQHLRNFKTCNREDLEVVLRAKLPDVLSDAQKRNRVKNLLAELSQRQLIAPERKGQARCEDRSPFQLLPNFGFS